MTDSKIWTNPAPDVDPFGDLVVPDNLDELAEEARTLSREDLLRRTKKFRVRARHELLCRPVYRRKGVRR